MKPNEQKLIDSIIETGLNDTVKIMEMVEHIQMLEDDQEMMLDINIKLKKEVFRLGSKVNDLIVSNAGEVRRHDDCSKKVVKYNTFLTNIRSLPWYKKIFLKSHINTFLNEINKA